MSHLARVVSNVGQPLQHTTVIPVDACACVPSVCQLQEIVSWNAPSVRNSRSSSGLDGNKLQLFAHQILVADRSWRTQMDNAGDKEHQHAQDGVTVARACKKLALNDQKMLTVDCDVRLADGAGKMPHLALAVSNVGRVMECPRCQEFIEFVRA